ncbi:MAG: LysR family transcriptional regulator [Candidatus Levyibacteriota bacterium]
MLDELERFIMVVQEGSFTKAAKKLFITQPALSLSIKRLEHVFSKKLFKRLGKRIVLTSEGESIYHLGLQILKFWRKAKNKNTSQSFPFLSIGIFDNAALRLSKYFQKKLTKNRFLFEIVIDRSKVLANGMKNGLYDICICVLDPNQNADSNYILVKKFSEKLYPVSSKIWKEKISESPFILYNQDSETRAYIDSIFLNRRIKPNIIVESTSPAFMKELAIGGCGIVLLPKNFVDLELKQKKLFIQKFPFIFKREIGLFLNKDSNLKETDETVREIMINLDEKKNKH